MGIWQNIHTVTTTDVSPDLGEFSEIIDDVSVEMIPIRYQWGCRTFQTASHIHVIHILGVWTPYTVVDGIWQHIHTVTTTDVSPDLGELAEILDDVSVQMIPLHCRWGCRIFQTASHIHAIHIRCLNTLHSCGWAYGSTLTPLPPQTYPQIWESWLKS